MKYNYDIYIKGKGWENHAACAIIVIEDGVEIFKGGKKFIDTIPTKQEKIPLLPFRTQYQMELYALAWALSLCEKEADVTVYSNNMVFKTWIEKEKIPQQYFNIAIHCAYFMVGKEVKVEHVKKGSDCFTEEVNRLAENFLPENPFKKF